MPKTTPQVYGYAFLIGAGGSLSLVTCLGMLAHLIGENVVSWNFIYPILYHFVTVLPKGPVRTISY